MVKYETEVWATRWICWSATLASTSTIVGLVPIALIPFLGLLTLLPIVSCLIILLYTVPGLLYLALAQSDASDQSRSILFPLNPIRNLYILRGVYRYVKFCADIIPHLAWTLTRYLLLERMLVKAREISASATGESDGTVPDIWEGFAVFGLSYHPEYKLDIYLPPLARHVSPRPHAPDVDHGSESEQEFSRSVNSSTEPNISARPNIGRPVIIFIYDIGVIGPVAPSRRMFALLGVKLAAMGYVVVIPDLPTYPNTNARTSVENLRYILSWVNNNISTHGGDPTQIYLMGHGLGAHLSLYTVAQQNIITSLRKRDAGSSKQKIKKAVRHGKTIIGDSTSTESDWETFSYFSPKAPIIVTPTPSRWRRSRRPRSTGSSRNSSFTIRPSIGVNTELVGWEGGEEELRVEDDLRIIGIYGDNIEVPFVKKIIMLSPVTDVIKQIKHESLSYLEDISPLRRMLGPSLGECMGHSLGHLLFAGRYLMDSKRMPKVLIIHGAQGSITPLDHSHWLHELLHGLDVDSTFRPYRDMTHWSSVGELMMGSRGEYADWLEKDSE